MRRGVRKKDVEHVNDQRMRKGKPQTREERKLEQAIALLRLWAR